MVRTSRPVRRRRGVPLTLIDYVVLAVSIMYISRDSMALSVRNSVIVSPQPDKAPMSGDFWIDKWPDEIIMIETQSTLPRGGILRAPLPGTTNAQSTHRCHVLFSTVVVSSGG